MRYPLIESIQFSTGNPTGRLRKAVYSLLPILIGSFFINGCSREMPEESPEMQTASRIAQDWNSLLLELECHTAGYRPTVSARMFAYVELAGYESAIPGMTDHSSMEQFLKGYRKPEAFPDKKDFDLPASLNAAYAQIIRNFFPTAPGQLLNRIDQMEADHLASMAVAADAVARSRSINFGKKTAETVWKWSATDSLGHDSFLYNYDRTYVAKDCPGCWKPSGAHPMPPLTPYWGKVRSFIVDTDAVTVNPPLPFSETPGSAYYSEAMEVFTLSQPLSRENHSIAEFWSDDVPGITLTSAGRWISIANQIIAMRRPLFSEVIETYLKTAIALCDASIICWNVKFRYNTERPQVYIRRTIQPGWTPLHESPSFPSYPSGHSVFAAAAAEIFTQVFGDHVGLTDRTYENSPGVGGAPRSYRSLEDMVRENALSRVALGVHYRMDCEEGLRLGKIIGQKIANLPIRKSAVSRF